jgi:hypothetical protein
LFVFHQYFFLARRFRSGSQLGMMKIRDFIARGVARCDNRAF